MDRHNEHNLTGQPGYGWDMTDKPFLTIREVADLLQVSNRTVYNLISVSYTHLRAHET